MATILMKSTKIATLGILRTKAFWNKDYNIIIFTDNVNNQIFPHDSNYTVDVVMWPYVIKTLFFIFRKAAEVALFLYPWSIRRTLSTMVSNLSKDVPATLMMMMMIMMIMNCFNCFFGSPKKRRLALFTVQTFVGDLHHRNFPIYRD